MKQKKKQKCLDCDYCQVCSKSRCRVCRSGKMMKPHPGLARCFTYEEYQQWKMKKDRAKNSGIQHVQNS